MSEMFIMPARGVYGGEFAEAAQTASSQQWAVPLKRTDEPVSPDDDQVEDQALVDRGEPVPVVADASFADEILGEVTFGLPERLRAVDLTRAVKRGSNAARWDYVGFRMMPSFAGPAEHLLWRLKLHIKLFVPGQPDPRAAETASALATAVYLEPQNILGKQVALSGEVGIDLGEIAKLFPPLQALKMQASIPFQARKYRPIIRLSGMDKHISSWYVADPELTSVFRPTVVAQFPASHRLAIEARLHVEIRKKVLGIPHKVYAISDPGVSLNYVRAPHADTFLAINPKVSPSRLAAILLGENPIELPPLVGENPIEPPAPTPSGGWVRPSEFSSAMPGVNIFSPQLNPRDAANVPSSVTQADHSGQPVYMVLSEDGRFVAYPYQPGTGTLSGVYEGVSGNKPVAACAAPPQIQASVGKDEAQDSEPDVEPSLDRHPRPRRVAEFFRAAFGRSRSQ